ncbi:putative ATPase, AAA-type, core, P-loop containing nucleoside triphosphate hydrolase [Helianthus anomalus]
MAKHLSYDIYDIDLSKVVDDSDLKRLLLQTTSKSIIVAEDLDRFISSNSNYISSNSNNSRVTLSGILNFVDGILNSCCGDEKLMVFTMNNKDNIDSAILRPGRIDAHIYFPLCSFNSFRLLANNCLGSRNKAWFV